MPSRKTLANAIRFLSIDAVQRAKSGHPGASLHSWSDTAVRESRRLMLC